MFDCFLLRRFSEGSPNHIYNHVPPPLNHMIHAANDSLVTEFDKRKAIYFMSLVDVITIGFVSRISPTLFLYENLLWGWPYDDPCSWYTDSESESMRRGMKDAIQFCLASQLHHFMTRSTWSKCQLSNKFVSGWMIQLLHV